MKISKKELITGILIPAIAIVVSVTNSGNWVVMTFLSLLFMCTIAWLWIANPKISAIVIVSAIVFTITGSFIYHFNTSSAQNARLETEPLSIVKGEVKEKPKQTIIIDTVLRKDSIKKGSVKLTVDSLEVEGPSVNKHKVWLMVKKHLKESEAEGGMFSYSEILALGYIRDRKTLNYLYKNRIPIGQIRFNYDEVWNDEIPFSPDAPLIICTIRNTGENAATIYGLSSKIICEMSAPHATSPILLEPLNKEFRLYPGKDLIFGEPILFEKKSVGTIMFSPTFREKEAELGGAGSTVLFSVSVIYYDGEKKVEALLGYYWVHQSV